MCLLICDSSKQAMPMPRITKRIVDALHSDPSKVTAPDRSGKTRVADQYLWDDELTGFGVKVTPAGRKVFLIQYRIGGAKGRTRRVTLGHLGPVTCDEARTRAKELLGITKQGKDPAEEKDKARAELTFGEVITRFESEHVEAKTKPGTAGEYKRVLRLYVPDKLRYRKIGDITEADVAKLHHHVGRDRELADGAVAVGRPYQANRLLAVLSKLFNWAEQVKLRPSGSNPCRHQQRYFEKSSERFLSHQELARLGAALAIEPRIYVVATIRLLLFTGARLNEIVSARWDWVDFERGTIRLPDSKTGAKTIYLNAPALAVLAELPRVEGNPFLIVGEKKGAHLVNMQKPWRGIRKAAEITDVRLHDLRHTFASVGVTGGGSLPMVGALLGHSQPQTTDRYSHLASDPLRAASDAIAKQIDASLKRSASGGNVVQIKQGNSA
jgi:integrase